MAAQGLGKEVKKFFNMRHIFKDVLSSSLGESSISSIQGKRLTDLRQNGI